MTRDEAAARAVAKNEDASNWDEEHADYQNGWLTRVDTILAAADAHDLAHGVHRIVLDDATVERAAEALYVLNNPVGNWDKHSDAVKTPYRDAARAVLAAAVQEESAVKEHTVTKYDDWPQSIDQTCCGKCVGDGCYVDRLTGERE